MPFTPPQTLCFVTFNKVVTAQYFCWWLALLPLVAPQSGMSLREAAALAAAWVAAEAHWLFWAYFLELEGRSTFRGLFLAGLLFLAANCALLVRMAAKHIFVPVFARGQIVRLDEALERAQRKG